MITIATKMATLKQFFRIASSNIGKRYLSLSVPIRTISRNENIGNSENDTEIKESNSSEYRFVFPEFLPDPKFEFRNKVREKLEREDMLKRRSNLNIPEFYVGSILACTTADAFAPSKENKFVGICVGRTYAGLRATFTLRNVVDNQGVEIMYDMYNPTIISLEVLRLEKRLDDELFYLRDANIEYSIFPFDMEPEFLPEGEPVPVNPLVVELKTPPWTGKWENRGFKGAIIPECLTERRRQVAAKNARPWEVYDLMKEYRKSIPEEDQEDIWRDVQVHRNQFQIKKHEWKKRNLLKARKKID